MKDKRAEVKRMMYKLAQIFKAAGRESDAWVSSYYDQIKHHDLLDIAKGFNHIAQTRANPFFPTAAEIISAIGKARARVDEVIEEDKVDHDQKVYNEINKSFLIDLSRGMIKYKTKEDANQQRVEYVQERLPLGNRFKKETE